MADLGGEYPGVFIYADLEQHPAAVVCQHICYDSNQVAT